MSVRNGVGVAVNSFGAALIMGTLAGIGISYLCDLSPACTWERWPLIQIIVLLFFAIIIVLHFFGIIGELFDSLVGWEKAIRPDRPSMMIRLRELNGGRLFLSSKTNDDDEELEAGETDENG